MLRLNTETVYISKEKSTLNTENVLRASETDSIGSFFSNVFILLFAAAFPCFVNTNLRPKIIFCYPFVVKGNEICSAIFYRHGADGLEPRISPIIFFYSVISATYDVELHEVGHCF